MKVVVHDLVELTGPARIEGSGFADIVDAIEKAYGETVIAIGPGNRLRDDDPVSGIRDLRDGDGCKRRIQQDTGSNLHEELETDGVGIVGKIFIGIENVGDGAGGWRYGSGCRAGTIYLNPPVYLNLYVLFTSNYSGATQYMGQPAALLTDMHVCPLVTGVVPHVGGPIVGPGCPTVLIG